MANKNAVLEAKMLETDETFDLDALEEALESQLEDELSDLEILAEEQEQIGSPDHLGEVIQGVVWEQFINQIAVTAGEDFIKENNNLTLDLRNSAHIQTTDNFAEGNIASHNTKIDYQQRYDDWQNNFKKDENGNVVTHGTRTGEQEATLAEKVRNPYDKDRPTGSKENHTDMDHTVSAGEIMRDPAANAHMSREEQIAFANSDANLNEMDASQNRSKKDKSMEDWLDNPNAKGQKPDEIFDMSPEEIESLRQKDAEAREEYEKQKAEGEKKSVATGKQSQKEEAFRIGKKALRAVLMQLLANLVRKIIGKMVRWFKSAKRELGTLLDGLKEAIQEFVGEMKTHLISAGDTVFTTVLMAIIGQPFIIIKKVWMMLKQGWKALKEAVQYLRDPKNKGQSLGRRLLETGKIVIAGMTGVSALLLGEAVEKGLMAVPIFAVEIPLIGSLANILGIFIGAVVAGIIGAIAINLIQKQIEKNQKSENMTDQVNKGNQALATQEQLRATKEAQMNKTKANMVSSVVNGHSALSEMETEFETAIDQNLKAVGELQNNNNDTSAQNAANDAALNKLLGAH